MPGLWRKPAAPLPVKNLDNAEQALLLLTRPLSKDLPDRHIASIKHVCAQCSQGCTLNSLPTVRKIYEIVLLNVRRPQSSPFVEVACELLRVLSLPFVRLHASEDLTLASNISDLFLAVGQSFQQDVPAAVQCSAAALFEGFINNVQSFVGPGVAVSAASLLGKQAHVRLLAVAQIAAVLVAALSAALDCPSKTPDVSSDFSIAAVQTSAESATTSNVHDSVTHPQTLDLPASLLQATVAFSTSKLLSAQLLSAGVLAPIAVVLNQGGVHDGHTALAVELLWNLLEACPQSDSAVSSTAAISNSTLTARHSRLVKAPKAHPPARLASEQASSELDGQLSQVASFNRSDSAADADVGGAYGMPDEAAEEAELETCGEQDSMQGTLGSAIEAESLSDAPLDRPDTPAGQPLDRDMDTATPAEDANKAFIGDVVADTTGDANIDAEAHAGVGENRAPSTAGSDTPLGDLTQAAMSPIPDDLHSVRSTATPDTSEGGTASEAAADMAAASGAESGPEASDPAAAAAHNVEQSVVAGIVRVLSDCLANGYSIADKELRNTVLVVAGLLAQSRQRRAALCCDAMLQLLVVMCTEPELADCSTAYLKASSQTIDEEDLEMRQSAWTLMTQLLQHDAAAVNAQAYSFVRVVLLYVQPGNGYEQGPLHWSKPQLATLRHAALGVLHTLGPCFPEAYDECNGPAVMVEFLAGCGDSKLLEAGLHHMHRACSASALLCGIWGAQGSMELALAVAADTTWPYRVRRSALLLVSVLCRGSSESARHFLLLEGIAILCLELDKLKLLGNEAATLYDFAVLDALWSGIVQSSAAMQGFLLADGLGTILDVLDRGAAALRPLVLTIIADALGSECGRQLDAGDIMYDWLSSKQQSACHVMLDLWRQEEAGKGIASPTMSPRSKAAPQLRAGSSGDLYMKIHAVFAQLGFAAAAGHVDLPDQATLRAVEHYFALQQGLVWETMKAKFAAEGLEPTAEDQARIEAGIQQAAEIRQLVAEKQQMLLREHADQLMQAEVDFVRAKKGQDERDAEARRYHKDTSTLTVKERLAARAKREQMLLDSFGGREEVPVFDDELVIEAFSRRPSHLAQQDILQRLSCSPSPGARSAGDLLRMQYPEHRIEARTHSLKVPVRRGQSNLYNGEDRPLSETPGVEGNEADYDDLQRDSGSDASDEEDFDSD